MRRKYKRIEESDFIGLMSKILKIPELYKDIDIYLGKYNHEELLFEELDLGDEIILMIIDTSDLDIIYHIQNEGETVFKTSDYKYLYFSILRKEYNKIRYTKSKVIFKEKQL